MTTPTSPAVPALLIEPGAHDWDETPREAARYDADYWVDRDWPTEPDDPADHYHL